LSLSVFAMHTNREWHRVAVGSRMTDVEEIFSRLSELLAAFRNSRDVSLLGEMEGIIRIRLASESRKLQSCWQALPSFVWGETTRFGTCKELAKAEGVSRGWRDACLRWGLLPGVLCLNGLPPDIVRRRIIVDLGRNGRVVESLVCDAKVLQAKVRSQLLQRLPGTLTSVRIAKMSLHLDDFTWPRRLTSIDLTLEDPRASTIEAMSHRRLPNLLSLRFIATFFRGVSDTLKLFESLDTLLASHGGTLRHLAINVPFVRVRDGMCQMTSLVSVTLEEACSSIAPEFAGWADSLAGCTRSLCSLSFLGAFRGGTAEMMRGIELFPSLRHLRSPLDLLVSGRSSLPGLSALETIHVDCGEMPADDDDGLQGLLMERVRVLLRDGVARSGESQLCEATFQQLSFPSVIESIAAILRPASTSRPVFGKFRTLCVIPDRFAGCWKKSVDKALAGRFVRTPKKVGDGLMRRWNVVPSPTPLS